MKKLSVIFLSFLASAAMLPLHALALSYGPLDVPAGENTYAYWPVATPQWAPTAEEYKPMGLGPAAEGGTSLNFEIATPDFAGPVDMYLCLQSDSLLNGEIVVFKSDNSAFLLSQATGDIRWRTSSPGNEYSMVLQNIPTALLPAGQYYFFLIVTPANSFNSYALWVTRLDITGNTTPVPPSGGSATEEEIKGNIDLLLGSGILEMLLGEDDILSFLMTNFTAMQAQGLVVQTPEELNLSQLSQGLRWDFDMKGGFTATDGSVLKGSGTVAITNIIFGASGLGADFSATLNNVTKDGALMANGSADGNLLLSGSSTSNTLTGKVNFRNLQTSYGTINGSLDIGGKNINADIFEGTVESIGSITLSTSGLTFGDYTINSGKIVITTPSSGSTGLDIDLSTNKGPVKMNLIITKQGSSRYTLNSNGTGTLGGYTISVENVVLDGSVCAKNPISGQMRFSGNGVNPVVTFHSTCDGSYDYSE